jgi:hypothetical protein
MHLLVIFLIINPKCKVMNHLKLKRTVFFTTCNYKEGLTETQLRRIYKDMVQWGHCCGKRITQNKKMGNVCTM